MDWINLAFHTNTVDMHLQKNNVGQTKLQCGNYFPWWRWFTIANTRFALTMARECPKKGVVYINDKFWTFKICFSYHKLFHDVPLFSIWPPVSKIVTTDYYEILFVWHTEEETRWTLSNAFSWMNEIVWISSKISLREFFAPRSY